MPILSYLGNLGMGGGGLSVALSSTSGGVRHRARKRKYIEAESNAEFLKAQANARYSKVDEPAPGLAEVAVKAMQIEQAEETRKTISNRDVIALLLMLSKL